MWLRKPREKWRPKPRKRPKTKDCREEEVGVHSTTPG